MTHFIIHSMPKVFNAASGAIEASWTLARGRTHREDVAEWGLTDFAEAQRIAARIAERFEDEEDDGAVLDEDIWAYQIDEYSLTGEVIQEIAIPLYAEVDRSPAERPYLQSEFI